MNNSRIINESSSIRFFDLIVSVLILVVLSPLLILLSLSIKIGSRGSVLFIHERVGRNGKQFRLFKFRSMVADAPQLGPYFTTTSDSRITPIGKFIRRTSLDELPQLVNVLKGEMSLVGPRPDVPVQLTDYRPEDLRVRLSVPPGLTGYAQIFGRSDLTSAERLAWDLKYVKERRLLTNIRILAATAATVFKRRGTN